MYKQDTCFMFKDSADWSIAYWSDFKTKSEFDSWMSDRLSEGLVYIGEEGKQEKVYPQVLSLDLKGPFGGYRTTVQSFSSAEDYNKYEQDQLWNGYKIIGSEPYKKFNDAENR